MNSIWQETAEPPRFASLREKKTTDVLIIGGGIAGILCAYKLKNAGMDCMLLEAAAICGGITKNTTAKITISHSLLYDKLIRCFGEEKARLYLEAQRKEPQSERTWSPTKTLRITTRKISCANGPRTWEHFQMRVQRIPLQPRS